MQMTHVLSSGVHIFVLGDDAHVIKLPFCGFRSPVTRIFGPTLPRCDPKKLRPVFPPILVKLFIAGATRTPHNMPCSRLEISSIRKRVVESTTLLSFVQLRWLAVRKPRVVVPAQPRRLLQSRRTTCGPAIIPDLKVVVLPQK